MNINRINEEYQINQRQKAVRILLGQKSAGYIYKRRKRDGRCQIVLAVYLEKSTYITDTLLLLINHRMSKVKKHGDVYEYEGYRFTADQIPEIDTSTLSEVKACNNTIDFGQDHYFKYVSPDGREHILFTNDKRVGTPYSEYMRGTEYDAAAQNYSRFWRYMMSKDPVYYGLIWSNDEVQELMGEAGIEHGFFTVKMGERESIQYYSASKTGGIIHSKERYDSKYKALTSTGYELMNYEPGSVFKLNGKEYVLSGNHTLDIPYGEDLWCLENPSNYVYGEKID